MTGQPGYWRSPLFPLAPILGLCLAAAFGVADLLDADDGRPSILILQTVLCWRWRGTTSCSSVEPEDGRHDW